MEQQKINKLMEIKKLYEVGILTKEEMEAEKAKILHSSDGTTDKQDEPNVEEIEIAPDAQPLPMDNTGRIVFDEPIREQTKVQRNPGNGGSNKLEYTISTLIHEGETNLDNVYSYETKSLTLK